MCRSLHSHPSWNRCQIQSFPLPPHYLTCSDMAGLSRTRSFPPRLALLFLFGPLNTVSDRPEHPWLNSEKDEVDITPTTKTQQSMHPSTPFCLLSCYTECFSIVFQKEEAYEVWKYLFSFLMNVSVKDARRVPKLSTQPWPLCPRMTSSSTVAIWLASLSARLQTNAELWE